MTLALGTSALALACETPGLRESDVDAEQALLVDDTLGVEPSEEDGHSGDGGPDGIGSMPSPNGQPQMLGQVTVDEADAVDPADPDELHIPVPPADAALVVLGAKGLLPTAEVTVDAAAAVPMAQELFADIARAQHVVAAKVNAVSDPLPKPFPGADTPHDVTFQTLVSAKGEMPAVWTMTMNDPGNAACARPLPQVEAHYFMFLREQADDPGWALDDSKPIVDGKVLGYPGVAASPGTIVAALAAAQEAQP